MHDALLMHVFEGPSNLADVLPYAFLRKADVLLDIPLHDLLEVTFFRPFDCDEKFIQLVVNEPV